MNFRFECKNLPQESLDFVCFLSVFATTTSTNCISTKLSRNSSCYELCFLNRNILAVLLWHLLAVLLGNLDCLLLRNLGAVLPWHLWALLVWHLHCHLLALLLWHLLAALLRLLHWCLCAAVLRDLLTFRGPIASIAILLFTLLNICCGALLFIACLVGGGAFLFISCGALVLVVSLVSFFTLLLVRGWAFCFVGCFVLSFIAGLALLGILSGALLLITSGGDGEVRYLGTVNAFWSWILIFSLLASKCWDCRGCSEECKQNYKLKNKRLGFLLL